MPIAEISPVSTAELNALFSDLESFPVLILAVSGGPDSIALMLLAARWRKALQTKPKLVAVTIDHGLRPEAKREAAAAGRLARKLGIAHRTLRWTGTKPATGLQQAARMARYRLLAKAARKVKAAHILTAHTLDDQAETVLIRMSRGSGVSGLAAMARISAVPGERQIKLVRPLLHIPKARLIATLRAAKIPFADDPSNRDPRFTRVRMRGLMSELAREGLDARRLALLALRLKRADLAIEAVVDVAEAELARPPAMSGTIVLDAAGCAGLPAEIALRLIGRALAKVGNEGPVELAKLEALTAALDYAQKAGNGRFRRSLAGAIVTVGDRQIAVERAPPRRGRALTTRRLGNAKPTKSR
ncbi:MAG: tRNA lysidine(34) synthetase TilS [Pseudolabrys sp.]